MAIFQARITSITKVDNRLDVGGVLLKDAEEFPMPVISLDAQTATKERAVELIKDEIRKFRDGYAAEFELQKYVGKVITL